VRLVKTTSLLLLSAAALAACDNGVKQQLATVSHVDSLRVDSLGNVRKDLLDEVMTSTQFINQINSELAKARALSNKPHIQLDQNSEGTAVNEERKQVIARVTHLVARLDSVQNRLAVTRRQAAALTKKDSTLLVQIATYEKSMAEMQASAEQQRAELQKTIDKQATQIATLNGEVDTLTNVKNQLTDRVTQLTSEKNTAYYVIGTKDELLQKGILVTEGHKRFLILGGRTIVPARTLDPTAFTKIDRLADRTIKLPEGTYEIFSRQNPAFAGPLMRTDGKLVGSLTINQPEDFWAPSKFLIIVRS
jgi:uncharacterized phage infection (PIP) family protein YhgE